MKNYQKKYLKYKAKYLELQNQLGSGIVKDMIDTIKKIAVQRRAKLQPIETAEEKKESAIAVKRAVEESKRTESAIAVKRAVEESKRTEEELKRAVEERIAAEEKLRQLLEQTRQVVEQAEFLKSICINSRTCIAIGIEKNKIRQFFDDYTTFNYINSIKPINTTSTNCFILEIKYSREDYNSYAILKFSKEKDSDNLFYEYLVGLKINETLNLRYPCFIETYGLYKYRNLDSKFRSQNLNELRKNNFLKDNLIKLPNNSYKIACEESDLLALLIQHIHNPTNLGDLLYQQSEDIADNQIFDVELPFALFQIYYALHLEKNNFTHYDLHLNNVLMFMPSNDKYIEYHYHIGSDVFSFKSKYMVKIIDYGRSYFNDSDNIHKTLCNTRECEPNCGEYVGFNWLDSRNEYDLNSFFINSTNSNESHDLKLLYYLKTTYLTRVKDYLKDILDKVHYDMKYGTRRVTNYSMLSGIRNVSNAFMKIKDLFNREIQHSIDFYNEMLKYERLYTPETKLGDLHVYDDSRNMIFNLT